jgi:hypothetical protein
MTVITSCVCLSGTLQFFSLNEKNWHNLMGYRSFLNACALQKKSVRFWRFWRF